MPKHEGKPDAKTKEFIKNTALEPFAPMNVEINVEYNDKLGKFIEDINTQVKAYMSQYVTSNEMEMFDD